uniref:Protein kinase domain-containing protein n=1 Tax=Anopheles farauti TaxID=69004 RepID=A0A182QBC9_9DIPT
MSSIILSGYEVLKSIGCGAYSKVFLVRSSETGKRYAAKRLIDPCSCVNDEAVFAELHLLRSLPRHPNISFVCDYVLENNTMTLIMELMDMNLYQYIANRKRPLSENRVRKMMFQIIQALDYLHANGIFHRDVKPENILVNLSSGLMGSKEMLQLADFGSAVRMKDGPPFTIYIATRWYRAPECMLSLGYYGPKIDVWAAGCVFVELLTLNPLFQGESELQMLDEIHSLLGSPSQTTLDKFRPLNTCNLGFPKRKPMEMQQRLPLMHAYGIDLLKRMLTYLPEQRISAKKMAHHIYFENLWKHKKVSKFSLSTQTLCFLTDDPSVPANGRSISRSSCDCNVTQKLLPEVRIPSPLSVCSNNTFHYVTAEEEKNVRNRQRERMWNMNRGAFERQNYMLEARRKQQSYNRAGLKKE